MTNAFESAIPSARFGIGEVVRHRLLDFRGVIFDVDPEFANSDEWYESIPEEMRPAKDQPFYHLLAENAAIVATSPTSASRTSSPDEEGGEVDHPAIDGLFDGFDRGPLPAPLNTATSGGRRKPPPAALEVDPDPRVEEAAVEAERRRRPNMAMILEVLRIGAADRSRGPNGRRSG